MGTKTKEITALVLVSIIALVSTPIKLEASTVSDLYSYYDVDYSNAYPNNIITTMRNYQNALRYVKKYRGVIESTFDKRLYQDEIKKLSKDLEHVSKLLLDSYDRSLSEIYSLEEQYVALQDRIDNLNKSMSVYSVSTNAIEKEDVPTYSDYCEAVTAKANIDKSDIVGDLDKLEVPIKSSKLLDKHSKTSTTYMTTKDAVITNLFSGYVKDIGEDYVVISNDYKIDVYYRNMSSICVDKGDLVSRDDALGTSYTYVTFQLSLDNNFVDISKLFEKE